MDRPRYAQQNGYHADICYSPDDGGYYWCIWGFGPDVQHIEYLDEAIESAEFYGGEAEAVAAFRTWASAFRPAR